MIKYKGIVKVYSTDKDVNVGYNNGTDDLFIFLSNCLIGNMNELKKPAYIGLRFTADLSNPYVNLLTSDCPLSNNGLVEDGTHIGAKLHALIDGQKLVQDLDNTDYYKLQILDSEFTVLAECPAVTGSFETAGTGILTGLLRTNTKNVDWELYLDNE